MERGGTDGRKWKLDPAQPEVEQTPKGPPRHKNPAKSA